MPLTDIEIRKLRPKDKPYRVFDGRGLYLEVAPSGGRWWRVKYRFGKEKRLSLGTYPDVSLKVARERCDEARRLLSAGVDPGAHRKAAKAAGIQNAANSFEVVGREWYEKQATDWSESHRVRVLSSLERLVFPYIGRTPIVDVTAPDLLAVVRRIEARAPETAHRTLSNCGQIIRYAVATSRCTRDPSGDLKGALGPIVTTHFAATTDPKRLGEILRLMHAYVGTITVTSALRLAPLVFVRPGELRKAQWADIDLEAAEWRYLVTKTKTQHIVPLSTQALTILHDLHPVTGRGRYVFPSARSASRPMSDNAVLAALRTQEIGKDELCGHGLRAVARTILDEVLNFRTDIIEHQLAHRVIDPNGRAYNRTAHLVERKRMMQVWADFLDELKKKSAEHDQVKATRPEVIEFRKRA